MKALPSSSPELPIEQQNDNSKDWTKVLFEIIIKILTLGFYHIEKHRKQ